jgi:hypothetical protein
VFAGLNLAALGYVWVSAIRRHRDRWLAACVALLGAEGTALLIGHGNCPLGPFQQMLGDPVPLFELVLPHRAAKGAIPVLTAITIAGLAALFLRGTRRQPPNESVSATWPSDDLGTIAVAAIPD